VIEANNKESSVETLSDFETIYVTTMAARMISVDANILMVETDFTLDEFFTKINKNSCKHLQNRDRGILVVME